MIRRAALAGGLLVVATVISSCSSPSAPGSDAVAAANGVELSRATLAQLVDSPAPGAVPTTEPANGASPASSDVRTVMTDWLRLAAAGVDMTTVTDRKTLQDQTEKAASALAEPFLGNARDAYAKGWDGSPSVCLAIISVAPDGDPQQVLDAITNGMTFAEAAAKYSADPVTAGAGGVVTFQDGSHCADPTTLNPAIADQMKGTSPGDPVVIDLGGQKAILLVRPFDELPTTDQISIDPTVAQQVQGAFVEQIGNADVFVSSRYGRWDDSSASVVALFNG